MHAEVGDRWCGIGPTRAPLPNQKPTSSGCPRGRASRSAGLAITLPTPAFSAFDVEDVELALNIAEDDVTAGHGGILHRYARPITAAGTKHPCLSWRDGHQVED
jgi:hypothetical protein